jgi:hypothetical protein
MRDTAIDGQSDLAAPAGNRSCVFFCEYAPRDKSWRWSWRPAPNDSGELLSTSVFASLNDCLLDAVRHGFQRDHISIRYSARQPCLSLLEKFDDRSKEFIRALKNLIPSGKLKPHRVNRAHSGLWAETPSEDPRAWQFSGSSQTVARDMSRTSDVR